MTVSQDTTDVIDVLPDRPLTVDEGMRLREDGRFLDLSYLALFGDGTFADEPGDTLGLIALLVNSGDERHLLAFSPAASEWQVVWQGSDESEDGLPFEDAEEWAQEHWGLSARAVFDMPGPEEGEQ